MKNINFKKFQKFHSSIIGGAGQTLEESFNLAKYVEETNNLDGVIIEVGVWNGGSAQILKKYKSKDKKMFLYDTFEGLKDCSIEKDGTYLKNGDMYYEDKYVFNLFNDSKEIIITKGYFPESATNLKYEKISFAHLDVDTYKSTLNSLNFIYDKMVENGVIIIHDYINNPLTKGVTLAVNEFLENKEENIFIPKGHSQGVIIKK